MDIGRHDQTLIGPWSSRWPATWGRINGLTARDYLVKKGCAVRASDMAFTLINTVPAAVADPDTTAIWEQALLMIETGELTLDVFIAKQAAWISQHHSASLPIKIS